MPNDAPVPALRVKSSRAMLKTIPKGHTGILMPSYHCVTLRDAGKTYEQKPDAQDSGKVACVL